MHHLMPQELKVTIDERKGYREKWKGKKELGSHQGSQNNRNSLEPVLVKAHFLYL